MADTRLRARARRAARRLGRLRSRSVHARLRLLEDEVQENRRLNRRVAELTDQLIRDYDPTNRLEFRGAQYDPATDPHGHRTYHAPVAPGSGWCSDDIAPPCGRVSIDGDA